MNNTIGLLGLTLSLALAGPALAAGDTAAGKAKSAACAGCHGGDGNSTNPEWPKLAGQHASYVTKQLMDFKSGARKNATMAGMVAGLERQDMEDLAAYFQAQERGPGEADPDLVRLGERIYRGGLPRKGVAACIGCHGPRGSGNPPAGFPALAGQHATYTAKTLTDFRRGDRANDPNNMMRMVALKLSETQIKAVSQYIAGLY